MEPKLAQIRQWLGTGTINIFGLPMSGKDTQGLRLAQALGAEFLSSGIIIRAKEAETHKNYTSHGALIPTNVFYDWVLPYFGQPEFADKPLVLSSVGRWAGEEDAVMQATLNAGHPTRAVVVLNVSEADVTDRFEAAKILGDRGDRSDDADPQTFATRLEEFRTKTLPVLTHYKQLNLLVSVNGDQPRDLVFAELVDKLYEFSQAFSKPTF